jgi:hypothetical protein
MTVHRTTLEVSKSVTEIIYNSMLQLGHYKAKMCAVQRYFSIIFHVSLRQYNEPILIFNMISIIYCTFSPSVFNIQLCFIIYLSYTHPRLIMMTVENVAIGT